MSHKKPPVPRWESFVEKQIKEARQRGEFDHLEGAGRPLAGLDGAHDELWWVKKLLQREKLSVLPPALEIKAKVERVLADLRRLTSEADVREAVATINVEIERVNRTTISGPPTTQAKLDPDTVVERWREQRDIP